MVASVIMPDWRIPYYAIQGTSSSSTWRAPGYSFLSVLTSASFFPYACHELFILESLFLSSNKFKVVDITLADFSDSSATHNLPSTHWNHFTVCCGPALFLSQILHYSALIDDIPELNASNTLLSIVSLPAANSFPLSAFPSQSQLEKAFRIIVWSSGRIQAHHQNTLAIATPNHDSPSPWTFLFMVLIRFIATESLNAQFRQSAPLTAITDVARITEALRPNSVLTISLNIPALLVIQKSNVLNHARIKAVSAFAQVLIFSPFTAVTTHNIIIVESLSFYAWTFQNAKELCEFLERSLDTHQCPRIGVPGFSKRSMRSVKVNTLNTDKVFKTDRFELENILLYQDIIMQMTLENSPHFIVARSPGSIDCYSRITLHHYLRNHRSEMEASTAKAPPSGRGSLIALERASCSIRLIMSGDRGGVFVGGVNTVRSPNTYFTPTGTQFFNICKAIWVFWRADVADPRSFVPVLFPLRASAQISVSQHDSKMLQTETHSLSVVQLHRLALQTSGISIQSRRPSTDHLESVSDAAGSRKYLMLPRSDLSRSSKDTDLQTVNFTLWLTAMGTVQSLCAPACVEGSGTAELEDSDTLLDASVFPKAQHILEDQVSGMASRVSGVSSNNMKIFNNPRINRNRNTTHAILTKFGPSCASRRCIHNGHLAFSVSVKQFLDYARGLPASQANNEFFQTRSVICFFLKDFNVLFKSIFQDPYSISVAAPAHHKAAFLEDIPLFDRLVISNICLKGPRLPLEDTAASTLISQNLETSKLPVPAPNTDSHTFPIFSQYPVQSNAYVAKFETPILRVVDSVRGHCVAGIPLCPASVYLEQILAGLESSCQHLCVPTDDKLTVLRAVEFIRPLVYSEQDPRIVITEVSLQDNRQRTFSVASRVGGADQKPIHIRGEYRIDPTSRAFTKFRRALPIIIRRISSIFKLKDGNVPQRFSTRTIYEVILSRVVHYSQEYQTIRSLTVDPTGLEGYASIKLPALYKRRSKFAVQSAFIDSILQVAGFLAHLQGGTNDAYICSRVDSIKVIPAQIENDATYGVYCSQYWLADQGIMFAEAYAVKLAEPSICVGRLKGIHFRKLRLDSLKRSLIYDVRASTTRQAPHLVHPTVQPLQASPSSTQSQVPSSVPHLRITGSVSALPPDNRSASDVCVSRTFLTEGPKKSMPLAADDDVSVRQILAAVLDIRVENIGDDDNLENLGWCVSSSLEIHMALKTKFGIEVPEHVFYDRPTLRKIRSYLARQRGSQLRAPNAPLQRGPKYRVPNPESRSRVSAPLITAARLTKVLKLDDIPLLLQNSTSSSLPLFLIHDGSGLISYYNGIPSLGRQVWGINNPRFISSEPWRSVVEMASFYARRIAKVTAGPIIIGGWSFGGVVAYEVSLQLAKIGVGARGVLLIDSPSPIHHVPLSKDLINTIIDLDGRGASSELSRLLKTQFISNAALLSQYDPRETGGTCPPLVFLRSSEGFNPPGVSNIPQWLADRSNPQTVTLGWGSLACGPIKVLDIPGHHFTPFKPANIKRVSERMAEACTFFEASC